MQWQIKSYELLDSTNLEAKRIIQASDSTQDLHGIVLTAEEQSQGRGRMGRQWESPTGTGLWFSAIIQSPVRIEQASLYSFVAAVAVAEAVRQVTALPATLKWPNDILLDGKKICGILLELVPQKSGRHYLVIGIGINVNQKQQDFPPELHDKATSLAIALGNSVNRTDLLMTVLQKLQDNCSIMEQQGFAPLRDKWKTLSCVIGQMVSVQQYGKELYTGIAEDIAMDGALLVQTEDNIVPVIAGDVSIRTTDNDYDFR